MICASRPVPRVVVTSAWVSPRVKIAEPWVRGSAPDFDPDRADRLEVATVDAGLAREDQVAHQPVLEIVQGGRDLVLR